MQQYQHANIPRIARFECTKHVIPFIQDWSALPSSTFWRNMLQQCCKHFDEICYPPQPVTAHQWRFCYRFLHISKCTKKQYVMIIIVWAHELTLLHPFRGNGRNAFFRRTKEETPFQKRKLIYPLSKEETYISPFKRGNSYIPFQKRKLIYLFQKRKLVCISSASL